MGIKICPICGGKIAEGRIDCIHCGCVLIDNRVECEDCGAFLREGTKECPECGSRNIIDKSKENSKIKICPICGGKVSKTRNDCIHCGFEFEENQDNLLEEAINDDGNNDCLIEEEFNDEDNNECLTEEVVNVINDKIYPVNDFESYDQFLDSVIDMIVIPIEEGKIKLWCTKANIFSDSIYGMNADYTFYCIFEGNCINDDFVIRYESLVKKNYYYYNKGFFGGYKDKIEKVAYKNNQKMLFPGRIIKDEYSIRSGLGRSEYHSSEWIDKIEVSFAIGNKKVGLTNRKFVLLEN